MLRLSRTLQLLLETLVVLAFAPSLLGCIGTLGPEVEAPKSLGRSAVGVTTIQVEDKSRDRELDVEIWYPADHPDHLHRGEIYELRAAATTVARLRSRAHTHRDAVAKPGRHPVVLLSHGAGSSRFANARLSEILASHGYIVAAPDHVGHSMGDFGIDDEDRAQSALDRPLDLSRVLDALASGDNTGPLDAGNIDLARVGVAGHSFGGRTALGLVGARFDATRQQRECVDHPDDRRCLALDVFGAKPYRYRDERVKAALLIMPAGFKFYRSDGVAQVDAPVLVVGAGKDHTTPFAVHHQPIFNALKGPRYMLELKRAGHLTATDVCDVVDSIGFLADAFGGERAHDGCGEGFLSSRDALEQVSEASISFFDAYLRKLPRAKAELAHLKRDADPASMGLCSGACS